MKIDYQDEITREKQRIRARKWRKLKRYEVRDYNREYMSRYRQTPKGLRNTKKAEKRYAEKLKAQRKELALKKENN